MIEELKKRFLRNWGALCRDIPRPSVEDVLATKTGDSTEETVRFHLFTKIPSGPVCVAKLVRNPKNKDLLRREFEVLNQLNRCFRAGGPASDSVPRPLELIDVRGETVLLLGILPGPPLERLLAASSLLPFGHGKVKGCLERLQRWMELFQQATMGERISENMSARKFNMASIQAAWNGESDRLVTRLGIARDELGTIQYVSVACHGGLSPASVIAVGPRGNQIMDWEGYRESGHPLDDALDLVISTAAAMSRWQRKDSRDLFSGPKSSLHDALFSFLFPFRKSAGLSARQTYSYMLLRAAQGLDVATGSRGGQNSSLSLLREIVDNEKQIMARLDRSAAA